MLGNVSHTLCKLFYPQSPFRSVCLLFVCKPNTLRTVFIYLRCIPIFILWYTFFFYVLHRIFVFLTLDFQNVIDYHFFSMSFVICHFNNYLIFYWVAILCFVILLLLDLFRKRIDSLLWSFWYMLSNDLQSLCHIIVTWGSFWPGSVFLLIL